MRYITVIFLCLLNFLLFSNNLSASQKEVNFVILANKGHQQAFEKWKPLADYLQDKSGYKINLIPYNFLQLESSLQNKTADILLSNPQYFVTFQERYGVKPLGTLKTGDYYHLCGVMISRKDSGIKNLSDIKGKKIAIVSQESAFGYLAQAALLLEKGLDIRETNEVWAAENQENVVFAVVNKAFQVGFLNAELYEKMIAEKKLNPNDINVINAYKDKNVPFLCSTETWPDWPLYASPNLDENISKKIQAILLEIVNDATAQSSLKIKGFVPPQDYYNVKKALNLLSGISTPQEEPTKNKKK